MSENPNKVKINSISMLKLVADRTGKSISLVEKVATGNRNNEDVSRELQFIHHLFAEYRKGAVIIINP